MISLIGLIVGTGRQEVGGDKRNAKLALYHETRELAQIDIVADDPKIGDRYDISVKKREAE